MLGGTGPFGRGLAGRLALGGAEVRIGSRARSRADAAAAEVGRRLESAESAPESLAESAAGGGAAAPAIGRVADRIIGRVVGRIVGRTNREAVAGAGTVFLAAPFAAQDALLRDLGAALEGRLLICCAVLWPPGSRPETSAAEEAERSLAAAGVREVRLAAAFQTVAAGTLAGRAGPEAAAPAAPAGRSPPEVSDFPEAAPLAGLPKVPRVSEPRELPDVLVFADRDRDREEAARAAALTGLRAVPAGPLRGVRAAEAAVGLLLDLGRRGTARHPGLRITGLPAAPAAAPAGEVGRGRRPAGTAAPSPRRSARSR